MTPYYDEDGIVIYHGDCRDVLPQLPDGGVVITDPPYSSNRPEGEFCATGNVAVSLHLASLKVPTMLVFGTSSGRGIEFMRSAIRALPHNRVLVWHRSFVHSPAAGPWRWDVVLIHVFGRGSFGRPDQSSLLQTDGTRSLAVELGHPSPVPVEVMAWLYTPFSGQRVIDPFMGSGSVLVAARQCGSPGIGIEVEEKYCEIAAERLRQRGLPLGEVS